MRSAPIATPTIVQDSVPRFRLALQAILGLMHLAQNDADAPDPAALADEAAAIFLPS